MALVCNAGNRLCETLCTKLADGTNYKLGGDTAEFDCLVNISDRPPPSGPSSDYVS